MSTMGALLLHRAASLAVVMMVAVVDAQTGSPAWLLRATSLQAYLGYDIPISELTFVATHNSFNNYDTSSVFEKVPNQLHSITTQLECLGVRGLELDPHLLRISSTDPETNTTTTTDTTYVCHAGQEAAQEIDELCGALGWEVCEACGLRDFGENGAGCDVDKAQTLTETFQEVEQWLSSSANVNEVLFIKLDSFMEGQDELVSDAIRDVFGAEIVFGPGDRGEDGAWPSPADMLQSGKQLIFFADVASTLVFSRFDDGVEETIGAQFFERSDCNGTPQPNPEFTRVQGDATRIELLVYNVTLFEDEFVDNFLSVGQVQPVMRCGMSPTFDSMDAGLLKSTIWSWFDDYPRGDQSEQVCAFAWIEDSRWRDRRCGIGSPSYHHACASDSDRSTDWTLSDSASVFTTTPDCPEGYSFAAPRSATENAALNRVLREERVTFAWIYAVSASGDANCWARETQPEYCASADITDDTCAGSFSVPSRDVTCLDPLAPEWLVQSLAFEPAVYGPNKVVKEVNGWKRLSGGNEWEATDVYFKDTLYAGVAVLVVGALCIFVVLPIRCCKSYQRGPGGAGGSGGDIQYVGQRPKIAYLCCFLSPGVLMVLTLVFGAVAFVGGLLSLWGSLILDNGYEVFEANVYSATGALLSVQANALAMVGPVAESRTLLEGIQTQCTKFTGEFDKLAYSMEQTAQSLDGFLEEDLAKGATNVNDGLEDIDDTQQPRDVVMVGISCLGVLLAFLYIASVLYAKRRQTAYNQRTAYIRSSGRKVLVDPSRHTRRSPAPGTGRVSVPSAAVAGQSRPRSVDLGVFWKGEMPNTGSWGHCLWLSLLLLLTVLMLMVVWALMAGAVVGLLYFSDFCIAPTRNIVEALSGEAARETARYYSTCETLPSWGEELLVGGIFLETSRLLAYEVDTEEFTRECPAHVDDLTALRNNLDGIIVESNAAGESLSCDIVNPYFDSIINEAVCERSTTGLWVVALGATLSAIPLFFTALALLVICRDVRDKDRIKGEWVREGRGPGSPTTQRSNHNIHRQQHPFGLSPSSGDANGNAGISTPAAVALASPVGGTAVSDTAVNPVHHWGGAGHKSPQAQAGPRRTQPIRRPPAFNPSAKAQRRSKSEFMGNNKDAGEEAKVASWGKRYDDADDYNLSDGRPANGHGRTRNGTGNGKEKSALAVTGTYI